MPFYGHAASTECQLVHWLIVRCLAKLTYIHLRIFKDACMYQWFINFASFCEFGNVDVYFFEGGNGSGHSHWYAEVMCLLYLQQCW